MYTDFHIHALPDIDDGSKDSAQSILMLKEAGYQNISKVVLTPHFYPSSQNIKEFLNARTHAKVILYQRINEIGNVQLPQIRLGAECAYVRGIEHYPDIEKLCVENTNYLLLEMPYGEWTDTLFEDLYRLRINGVNTMIAHPDRFWHQISKYNAMQAMYELECILQVNAYSFIKWHGRKNCLSLLESGIPCVLGSDMHAPADGTQKISDAMHMIDRKMGRITSIKVQEISDAILENFQPGIAFRLWNKN